MAVSEEADIILVEIAENRVRLTMNYSEGEQGGRKLRTTANSTCRARRKGGLVVREVNGLQPIKESGGKRGNGGGMKFKRDDDYVRS